MVYHRVSGFVLLRLCLAKHKRKNWLFANTAGGATASAILYSMVESAKENGLSPYAYLKYLLEQLPNTD